MVISGHSIFRFIDTKGIPLENILMVLNRDETVIDWMSFIDTSMKYNWKLKGTLVKIENSITEIYGKEYSKEIMKRVNGKLAERSNAPDLKSDEVS